MKLYFSNECLGEIKNVNVEGMWVNGNIIPNKNIEKFKAFFAAIVNEENELVEANFNKEWLDDNNWYIIDNQKEKKGIVIPAVYPDGDIYWRWR
ncbi:hypothetical protein [Virgibacillus sp. Bac330]|uniref:hypothetical protein n=1 Tax=Virgibacillus sp. Bac330 TaxID=2419841 RepID=UPI000EF4F021|nr:hypothetical protein [Virgibacillus sp. Bac330]